MLEILLLSLLAVTNVYTDGESGPNPTCGGEVETNAIEFPTDGKKYLPNMDCTWVIRRNFSFILKFTRFDVEGGEGGCEYDFLQIGEGMTRMGYGLCGSKPPDDIFVDGTVGATTL